MTTLRWYHLLCLAALLLVGTLIRLPDIGRFGCWRDEYWGLYLAAGRGDALFQIPPKRSSFICRQWVLMARRIGGISGQVSAASRIRHCIISCCDGGWTFLAKAIGLSG